MNNKNIFKEFIFFTVIPFLIPFILEIPTKYVSLHFKWGMIIIIVVIDFYFSYKSLIQKQKDINKNCIHESLRYAYSGAHEIIERKRDNLSHETELKSIDIRRNMLPYDVHAHITDICKEFKKVIASITKISNEFISVTFIYRYTHEGCSSKENEWKWISGREPINDFSLNEFVNKEDTTFYHIINDKINYIFGNNKEELAKEGYYHLGARDKMYNNLGSVFSIKLAFGNNIETFVQGIITVTTHGKQFVDENSNDITADMLRNMIIDEVFPYYRKLIENEMGILYIRHRYRKDD